MPGIADTDVNVASNALVLIGSSPIASFDDNDAGETEFIENTISTMSVKCIGGRAIVFPPMFPWVHCGKKPVNKPKYLLQSYLHYTLPINKPTKSESEMLVRQRGQ